MALKRYVDSPTLDCLKKCSVSRRSFALYLYCTYKYVLDDKGVRMSTWQSSLCRV